MIIFNIVSKVYDNVTVALKNFNLKIDDGEFVFVVGPSGAGKSTLIKLLMKEEDASEGSISVNGYDLQKIKRRQVPYLRRTMGVMFQDFRLIPELTVFDNVAFAMRITGASNRSINKRVKYILELMGIKHKAKNFPYELSGGEQQRVALSRALVNNPSLIIADEPTGNVDPKMSAEIMELLSEINKRKTTVLVVTHEKNIVNSLKKRVVYIEDGNLRRDVEGGTYDEE